MSKFITSDFKESPDQNISRDMMSKASEIHGVGQQRAQYATQTQNKITTKLQLIISQKFELILFAWL